MDSPISLYLILLSLTLLSQIYLSFSTIDEGRRLMRLSTSDVYDLLPKYGLPKGIIPDNVKSYTISSSGEFTIELGSTCYVHFDKLVYYEKTIRGKLSYGAVKDVSGIQAKMFIVWLPVTGIEVDGKSDFVKFFVGSLSKTLPAKQFQDVPACGNNGFLMTDRMSSM